MTDQRRAHVRPPCRTGQSAQRLDDGEVRLRRAVLFEAGAARDEHPVGTEARDKRTDQGRLADPRLAGDETQLPAAALGPFERRAQRRQLGLAPHHERISGGQSGQRGCLAVRAELGHEPVPSADHGLDDPLAEHLPKLVQVAAHGAFTHHGTTPHLGDELLARDELLRPIDQVAQDREGLAPQDERGLALPQAALRAVEAKRRKKSHAPALSSADGTGRRAGAGDEATPIGRHGPDPTEIQQPWTRAAGMVGSCRRFDIWWSAPTSATRRNRPSSWPSAWRGQTAVGSPWSTFASWTSMTGATSSAAARARRRCHGSWPATTRGKGSVSPAYCEAAGPGRSS